MVAPVTGQRATLRGLAEPVVSESFLAGMPTAGESRGTDGGNP